MAIKVYSSDIQEVFPSTKTQTINKLITEHSITRLINRLLDVDGYVISSEFYEDAFPALVQNGTVPQDYLPLSSTILSYDLEFCIRGYYFNLGKMQTWVDKMSTERLDSLQAVIYISDDTKYPELYGQDVYEGKSITGETGETITLERGDDEAIVESSIVLLDVDGNKITDIPFKLDEENDTLVTDPGDEELEWGRIHTVKYSTTSITEVLLLQATGTAIAPKDGYTYYTLTLFETYEDIDGNTQIGIPISSLHKFDTISVATIDGGIEPYIS